MFFFVCIKDSPALCVGRVPLHKVVCWREMPRQSTASPMGLRDRMDEGRMNTVYLTRTWEV